MSLGVLAAILSFAGFGAASAGGSGSEATAEQPIVGVWSYAGSEEGLVGMNVEVKASATGFVGVVTRQPTWSGYASLGGPCNKLGFAIWPQISGSGLGYTGKYQTFVVGEPTCKPYDQPFPATWTITESGNLYKLNFCRENAGTYCWEYQRPKPATTTSSTTTSGTGTTTGRAPAAANTYIVPAGQTKGESKPTMTGAGQYSLFAPTFDRAAKNNYPNRAKLLGEVYLGDGGATATYSVKTLSPTARTFWLWIYITDDGLHSSGDRSVSISIPALNWSARWSNPSEDTKGWKAVKVGSLRTSGNFTIGFRKEATTSAAFVMNAFAFTTSAQPPAFGPAAATTGPTTPAPGLWRLSINKHTYRFVTIKGGFEQRAASTGKSQLGCLIPAGKDCTRLTGSRAYEAHGFLKRSSRAPYGTYLQEDSCVFVSRPAFWPSFQ